MDEESNQAYLRKNPDDQYIIDYLMRKYGVTTSVALRMALRAVAREEKIELPKDKEVSA